MRDVSGQCLDHGARGRNLKPYALADGQRQTYSFKFFFGGEVWLMSGA